MNLHWILHSMTVPLAYSHVVCLLSGHHSFFSQCPLLDLWPLVPSVLENGLHYPVSPLLLKALQSDFSDLFLDTLMVSLKMVQF
jgi:hypothetical protein